jgi:hypothetical protein
VSPWLHEVWSEETEPLTVWTKKGSDPGRDASLKYRYDPNIPAPIGATKPAKKEEAKAPAAAPAKKEEAKEVAAALSQLPALDIDTILSHKFEAFF